MKLLILVSFLLFISEYTISAQSQQCILPIATIQIQNVDKSYPKPNGLNDTIEYESNLHEWIDPLGNSQNKPELKGTAVEKPQMTITQKSMPCYKPEGSFPMLMLEPDTTIRYSLLIKKE